ncbi:hypothetical protein ACFL2P_00815 [Candidatus Moduliflexota bacterium]
MTLKDPGSHGVALPATALALLLLVLPAGAAPGDGRDTFTDQLPADSLFCPLAGKERRLNDALAGRPLVVFLTDIHYGVNNPLGERLAELQSEYGPWFSWAGVLIGEARREEIKKIRTASPLRFESCFHDVEGRWWQSLGLGVLPLAVVVNEDGYILGKFSAIDEKSFEGLASLLDESARSCNLRGRSVLDFRLPEPGTARLPSLLDVAEKDFTMIFFLQTSCPACFRELKVLDRVRKRYRDRVGLVTIFHDSDEGGAHKELHCRQRHFSRLRSRRPRFFPATGLQDQRRPPAPHRWSGGQYYFFTKRIPEPRCVVSGRRPRRHLLGFIGPFSRDSLQ